MKRIVVITTGGTIAMRSGTLAGGAVPSLKGDDFLAMMPRSGVELTLEEFMNVPSSHFTPSAALDLAHRVEALLLAPHVDGIVITHGADTLEETAYLVDLTVRADKPVVLTGAMRSAANPAYDGVTNLAAAIRVAALPAARELGVAVVFADAIYAAAEVQQVHTQTRSAFAAPGSGPLGHVEGERVVMRHRPAPRQFIPCSHLEERVDLIRLTQGADVRQLRHSIDDGMAGIVIEAFGSGRVPPWWLPLIGEAMKARIAVAVASRCAAGGLGDEYGYVGAAHDLQRMGVLFAHNLSGPKARIKLMVALGAARSPQELRGWFGDGA
jgi:L-asparaginase